MRNTILKTKLETYCSLIEACWSDHCGHPRVVTHHVLNRQWFPAVLFKFDARQLPPEHGASFPLMVVLKQAHT